MVSRGNFSSKSPRLCAGGQTPGLHCWMSFSILPTASTTGACKSQPGSPLKLPRHVQGHGHGS